MLQSRSFIWASVLISKDSLIEDGGFHVVAKIIRELKSHVIPYKFKSSHWLRANLVKDIFTWN